MRHPLHYLLIAFLFLGSPLFSQKNTLEEAGALEEQGKFREASVLLRSALQDTGSQLTDNQRSTYAFELDRLRRIRIDYSLTKEDLFKQLQRSLKDFSEQEYSSWIKDGRFDFRTIDDTIRFVAPSRSNLFWRYPELTERRIQRSEDTTFEVAIWNTVRSISALSLSTGNHLVLPKHFKVKMTVTVEPNVVPPGDTIRAWLPVPRDFPHQRDFALLASSSPAIRLADPDSPIRSAFLQQIAVHDQPTVFWIEYTYTTYGVRFQLKEEDVQPVDPGNPDVARYTGEAPHIVFTDRIKDLSRTIVEHETNPLIIARKFYEWISEHIKYSYAREYSTLRNIGDYCLTHRYGDCGQEALLFMTLCRYNGIPSRWQSGWFTAPGGKTIHDWTEIYIAPYGWIPVDPYMGIFAAQYFPGASIERRMQVRDFFFGGLDQYRMAANSDHCQTLSPPKKSLRSDTVDFQRGEVECGDTNIYFDTYDYDLETEEVPLVR